MSMVCMQWAGGCLTPCLSILFPSLPSLLFGDPGGHQKLARQPPEIVSQDHLGIDETDVCPHAACHPCAGEVVGVTTKRGGEGEENMGKTGNPAWVVGYVAESHPPSPIQCLAAHPAHLVCCVMASRGTGVRGSGDAGALPLTFGGSTNPTSMTQQTPLYQYTLSPLHIPGLEDAARGAGLGRHPGVLEGLHHWETADFTHLSLAEAILEIFAGLPVEGYRTGVEARVREACRGMEAGGEARERADILLLAAVGLLLGFVRNNWTGPPSPWGSDEVPLMPPRRGKDRGSDILSANSDLAGAFPLSVQRPLDAVAALAVLEALQGCVGEARRTLLLNLDLWTARALFVSGAARCFGTSTGALGLRSLGCAVLPEAPRIRALYLAALDGLAGVGGAPRVLLLAEACQCALLLGDGDGMDAQALHTQLEACAPCAMGLIGMDAELSAHSSTHSTILTASVAPTDPWPTLAPLPSLACPQGLVWLSPDSPSFKEDPVCPEVFLAGGELKPIPHLCSGPVPVQRMDAVVAVLLLVQALEMSVLGQGTDDALSQLQPLAFLEALVRGASATTPGGIPTTSFVPPSVRIGALGIRALLRTSAPSLAEVDVLQLKRIRESTMRPHRPGYTFEEDPDAWMPLPYTTVDVAKARSLTLGDMPAGRRPSFVWTPTSVSPAERLAFFFASARVPYSFPCVSLLQAEGLRGFGSLALAAETFVDMHEHARAAECLAQQGDKGAALGALEHGLDEMEQLEQRGVDCRKPKALLLCVKGELEADPALLEAAWDLSDKTLGRAQRSLVSLCLNAAEGSGPDAIHQRRMALAHLQALQTAEPLSQRGLLTVGLLEMGFGAYDKAAAALERALALGGPAVARAAACLNLAACHQARGNPQAALQTLVRSAKLHEEAFADNTADARSAGLVVETWTRAILAAAELGDEPRVAEGVRRIQSCLTILGGGRGAREAVAERWAGGCAGLVQGAVQGMDEGPLRDLVASLPGVVGVAGATGGN